jgi:hypothetical protein
MEVKQASARDILSPNYCGKKVETTPDPVVPATLNPDADMAISLWKIEES